MPSKQPALVPLARKVRRGLVENDPQAWLEAHSPMPPVKRYAAGWPGLRRGSQGTGRTAEIAQNRTQG